MVKYSSLVNTRIDRYTLLEKIGSGGMATVFRAHDNNLGRDVAMKVLHKHLADEEGFKGRFVQEARTIASLNHPNIVQVYDFNVVQVDGEALTYMVMRYVADRTLDHVLKDYHAAGEMMPIAEVQRVMLELCAALSYAHGTGMVHRDLKPSNILIEQNGRAVLTDFGIVKLASAPSQHTQEGTIVGTPVYMSPEQASGDAIDPRSDLYSLGVILYELLAGRTPFQGDDTVSVLVKHIQTPPPPLSNFVRVSTDAYDRIIERALAKDAAQRYQTAAEFASDIRTFLLEERVPTRTLATVTASAPAEASGKTPSRADTTPARRHLSAGTHTFLRTLDSAVLAPARQNPLAFIALTVAVVALLIVAQLAQERPVVVASAIATPPGIQEIVSAITTDVPFPFMTFNPGERFLSDWQQNAGGIVQRVMGEGVYTIRNTVSDVASISLFAADRFRYADVTLTMDARLTEDSAPTAAYGLVFRYQDPDNYNVFAVDGEGRFSLWTRANGIWSELRGEEEQWTPTDAALPRGQVNKITIVVFRDLLVGYINSQQVVRLQEDTFDDGAIGIYVASPTDGLATVSVESYLIARGENPTFSMTDSLGGVRRPTMTPRATATAPPAQTPTQESTQESQS